MNCWIERYEVNAQVSEVQKFYEVNAQVLHAPILRRVCPTSSYISIDKHLSSHPFHHPWNKNNQYTSQQPNMYISYPISLFPKNHH